MQKEKEKRNGKRKRKYEETEKEKENIKKRKRKREKQYEKVISLYLGRGIAWRHANWPPIVLWKAQLVDAVVVRDEHWRVCCQMVDQDEVPNKNYPCFVFSSIVSSLLARIRRFPRPQARKRLAEIYKKQIFCFSLVIVVN